MTKSKKTTIIVCICIVCICTFIFGIVRGDRGTKPFAELKTENIVRVKTAFEQPDGAQYVLSDKEVGTLADYLRKVRINSERLDPAIDGGFIGMFYLEMKDSKTIMVSANDLYFTYGDDPLNADMYQVDNEMIQPIEDMFFELANKYASQEFKERHRMADPMYPSFNDLNADRVENVVVGYGDKQEEQNPHQPFADISPSDVLSAFVYKSWYNSTADDNKYYLSSDEIKQLLDLLKPIMIDREKGKAMQKYLGGPSLFYITLNNDRKITVGAHAGYGLIFYNGMEYKGNYNDCALIDKLCRKMETK